MISRMEKVYDSEGALGRGGKLSRIFSGKGPTPQRRYHATRLEYHDLE
jgi:hypothetical protein